MVPKDQAPSPNITSTTAAEVSAARLERRQCAAQHDTG